MKKVIFLVLFSLFFTFFLFPAQKINISKGFVLSETTSNHGLNLTLYRDSFTPKKGGYIAGNVIGGIGTGLFVLNHFIHILISLIAPPVLCDARGTTLIQRPLNIGIMASGWIPVIGPFANLGILVAMSRNGDYYFYGSRDFYDSMIVYCGLLGFIEIAFITMMIVGFSVAYKHKGYKRSSLDKILPVIATSFSPEKNDIVLGIKVKL